MSKISEERLRGILEELGVEWETTHDDTFGNEDSFELLYGGVVGQAISDLKNENNVLKEKIHSLWAKHSGLMTYLGLEEVTWPQKTEIRKIKKTAPKRKIG